MEGTNFEGCGPLRWSETTTKVVVVGMYLLMQQGYPPCKCVWGCVGPRGKIPKMKQLMDTKDQLVDFLWKQVSDSNSPHKNQNKSLKYRKNLKMLI